MKKILLAAALLLTSLSANAESREYYKSDSWEVFYVGSDPDVCSIKKIYFGITVALTNIKGTGVQMAIASPKGSMYQAGRYPASFIVRNVTDGTVLVTRSYWMTTSTTLSKTFDVSNIIGDEFLLAFYSTSTVEINDGTTKLILPHDGNLDTALAWKAYEKCVNQHIEY
jgi:hypothetical protein